MQPGAKPQTVNDRFSAMQTYVRAVDSGSMSTAALVDLGRSLAAVSRTISELEARLGVRRSTAHAPLTPMKLGSPITIRRGASSPRSKEAETGIGAERTAPRGPHDHRAADVGRLHVAPVLIDYRGQRRHHRAAHAHRSQREPGREVSTSRGIDALSIRRGRDRWARSRRLCARRPGTSKSTARR